MNKIIAFTVCLLSLQTTVWGQISIIRPKIEKIFAGKNLKIGVAILDLSNGDTLSIHANDRFPMQSVFKLHLAIAVLHEIDQKAYRLEDSIYFSKSELYSHLWSPLQTKHPHGGVKLPLSEVIQYTLQLSDNSGCDKLLQLIGGPEKVNKYIHSIGIEQINIENNEFELQSSWDKQFNNWTTPLASIQLLKMIHNQSLLGEKTQKFLWETLLTTSTGSIRQKLPEDAIVAYKTGFSGQNAKGEIAAINNIGIMTLPNNHKIAYAIFITESTEEKDVNYSIIADIGKCIYNSFFTIFAR